MDLSTAVGLAVGAFVILKGAKAPPVSVPKPRGYPVGDFKLSEHFTFWELTNTSRKELREQNRVEAVAYQTTLRELATKLLEPIRAHFNAPVLVSSAFRGTTLNKVVGGAGTSQHLQGQAADITVKDVPHSKVFEWVWKESGLPFGQLILESVGASQWVHISTGGKHEVLTYKNGKYTKLA